MSYHYDDMLRDEPWIITRGWHNGGGGVIEPLYYVHHIHPETGHVKRRGENLHQTIPCSNDWEGVGRGSGSIIYRCRTCSKDAPDRINGFMTLLRWRR